MLRYIFYYLHKYLRKAKQRELRVQIKVVGNSNKYKQVASES